MDKKISQLTELAQADIATGDLAAIVDVSDTTDAASGTTKKFTWASIRGAIATYLASLAQTLTNKTIDLTDNTLRGTTAEFNAALSDGDFATLAGTETLTNKTITTPTLTLKQDTNPTPTAEGDIQWDTDDNKIKVGDGTGTKTFSDDSVTSGIHGVTGNIVGTTDIQTLLNKTLGSPSLSAARFTTQAYFQQEVDNGNSGISDTIDWTAGNKQKSTLTGNVTFTFIAPTGPCNLILKLVQDATGSRTVTWPSSVKWPGGTAPTLSTAANSIDIISFYFDGTNYYGQAALNFS